MTDHRDRAVWRAGTCFVGIQWSPTRIGFDALELRNRRDGNTRSRPLGSVTVYVGGEADAECHCCGERFRLEDGLLDWSGRYPTGPCCCSPECRERFEREAQTVCCDCGESRPTQVCEDGGICTLCAARRVRADVVRLLAIDDCDAVRGFAAARGYLQTNPVDASLDTTGADRSTHAA